MTETYPSILCTGPLDPAAVEPLSRFAPVVVADANDEAALVRQVEHAIGLIVRGDVQIGPSIIEAGGNLRVIGRTGAGYSNIDIAAATGRSIPVVYAPGAGSRAVAEAAFTYMLTLCKSPAYWDAQLKAGNWASRNANIPGDLDGATLGIVGFGNIGRIVARIARAFEMTVLAFDPFVRQEEAAEHGADMVELDELLARCDFVSLHAPLTEHTRHLINRENIGHIKHGAYLINLGRGPLIESLDLVLEALDTGRLAGVALDVFDPEPPDVSHPIFKHPRLLTSPHIMGVTQSALRRLCVVAAEGMIDVFEGRKPRYLVNPEALDLAASRH